MFKNESGKYLDSLETGGDDFYKRTIVLPFVYALAVDEIEPKNKLLIKQLLNEY